jgi:thioredoxin reductase
MANREYDDVIIIGGGPARLSAGIYALRASMRTVLIEKGCRRTNDTDRCSRKLSRV